MIRKVLLTAISAVVLLVLGAAGTGLEADSATVSTSAVSTSDVPEISIASPPRPDAPSRVLTASSNDNPTMAVAAGALGAGVLVVTLALLTRRRALVVVPATIGIDAPPAVGIGSARTRRPTGDDQGERTPLRVPGPSGSGLVDTD